MVEMVATHGGCTTDQVHTRFWQSGSPLAACYRRLALLVNAGYLHAHRLPSLTGIGSGKRFLTLGTMGRALLAEQRGISVARPTSHEPVTPLFADHHLAVGAFHLALELAVAGTDDIRLGEWIPEGMLRRSPIRVRVPTEGNRPAQAVVLIPDGAFTLLHGKRRKRYVLEMDMGTITPQRLRLKVRGYLVDSATPPIPVLLVVPTEARARRVSQMIQSEARTLGRPPSVFFVATRVRITPIWEQVGVADRQAIIRSTDRSIPTATV
jgi:hypothetical protein